MRDVFIKELVRQAAKNPNIVLITGDLGFGVLDEYRSRFPRQFINAGLTEPHMASMAAGMAKEGKKVFTYSIGNFVSLRALEQIRIDIAYHNANVTAVCIGGGLSYGQLGMTHHATEDLSIMRALPNMTVAVPGDDFEVESITRWICAHDGPAYLRLDKTSMENTNEKEAFNFSKFRKLRADRDITLVASGGILKEALTAADELESNGIGARVLSAHSLRPFDAQSILKAVKETGGIVTIEENVIEGGLGGAVAEVCLEAGVIPKKFYRIGLRNGFSSVVGTQEYLRSCYGLDAKAIVEKVKELVGWHG